MGHLGLLRMRLLGANALFVAVGVAILFLASPRSLGQTAVGASVVVVVSLYPAIVAYVYAPRNRGGEDAKIRDRPGPANLISLARGVPIAVLCALIAFGSIDTRTAWAASALYGGALAADLLDGWIARRRGETSELGRHLENEVDSLGCLAASAFLVAAGTLPWYYLTIGLARYLFLLGVNIRSTMGLPTHRLRHSRSGRILAGLQMNALLVGLFPFVPDALVRIAMPFVSVPFLAGFLRDFYGVCTGRRLRLNASASGGSRGTR